MIDLLKYIMRHSYFTITQVIRDFHLFGLIFVFLVVDLIIFTVWTTVDPLQKNKQHLPNEVLREKPLKLRLYGNVSVIFVAQLITVTT